ncbi:MAG: DUF5615 family PIN-like protein [Chloroflexota bacterium]|nr:DUF5615 family PIN-like protein [Chloroflexota bacterium]
MLRLLADENFKFAIVQGLLRGDPTLDIVRVQAIGLAKAPDERVLAWAASEDRLVLTHDIKTMPSLANARLAGGAAMPGVIVIPWSMPVGHAIEGLLIFFGANRLEEFVNQVNYLAL